MIRLSQTQERIVAHLDGAMLVVAGPGSGKTRVVTERIRRLLSIPKQHFRVLALTFTNKAANEMVERLEDVEGVRERAFVGTMHSFCTEVLTNRGKSVGITGLPNIFESFQDRKQVLADAVRSDPELTQALRQAGDSKKQSQRLDQWLSAIGDAKNNLRVSEMVEDLVLRRLYEAYDAGLRACGAVDFDDLLLLTYRLFEERPEIASFYRRQYRYVCVDEAQDLNEAQYRVLCSLCGKEYFNILMVGDPKQAIFVWNGASPAYMEAFVKDFHAERVELSENFRSSQAVVSAARALDRNYVVEGQLPIEGQLTIQECPDEETEAAFLSSEVGRLLEEGHPDIEGDVTLERIGILGRNKFVFKALETLLTERNIAFHKKVSASTYESESDTLEEFELALRVLSNPLDRLHLGKLLTLWKTTSDVNVAYRGHDLRTVTGLELLDEQCAHAKAGHCKTTMAAIRALNWTPDSFRFVAGIKSIEQSSISVKDEETRPYNAGYCRMAQALELLRTLSAGRTTHGPVIPEPRRTWDHTAAET